MNNKLGVVQWCLPCPEGEHIRTVRELGLDCIHLDLGSAKDRYPMSDPAMQRDVQRQGERYCVELTALALNDLGNNGFVHAEGDERSQIALNTLRIGIETAAAMGIPAVTIPHFFDNASHSEASEERSFRALKWAGSFAAAHGVKLYTENTWPAACVKRLFAQIPSDNIRLLFDTQNYAYFSDLDGAAILGELYPHIGDFVHLKDGVSDLGDVLLGRGRAKVAKITGMLASNGFRGAMILENSYNEPNEVLEDVWWVRQVLASVER